MSTSISALTHITPPLGGSEPIPCVQGGVTLKCYPSDLATYVFSTGISAVLTDIVTLVGAAKFPITSSGSSYYTTGTEIATWTTAQLWANATAEAGGGVTGDLMLMYRSGTGTITITIDQLATYINTGSQASVLNLSTLGTVSSFASTALILVCPTTTGNAITAANFETQVFADFAAYVIGTAPWAGLATVSALSGSESIYCVQSGTPKQLTPATLAAYLSGGGTFVTDPGSGNISLGGTGCSLLITATGTSGLPVPTQLGQQFTLTVGNATGGNTRKVALGAFYNSTPTTTVDGLNKFATFSRFGQSLTLIAIPASLIAYQWVVLSNQGTALTQS